MRNIWMWFVLLSIDLFGVSHAMCVFVFLDNGASGRVHRCTVYACQSMFVPA